MHSVKLNFGIIIELKFAMNELPRTFTSVVYFLVVILHVLEFKL